MSFSSGHAVTMAEFFGILASLTGLISLGTKLSAQISQFAESFRSTPQNARDLVYELQELCSILDRLWKAFSGRQPRENDPLLNLRDVLDSCGGRFGELEKFANAHMVREGDRAFSRQMRRWKWVLREKEVAALRNLLEEYKATLAITLLLSTDVETTSVKDTADRIQTHIHVFNHKLTHGGDKANLEATYSSAHVLKRYLESCSTLSVFSSPSPAPVYQKRVRSQLPRVDEDEIQRLHERSKSAPPSDARLGEDIIRSASATSMRPARYVSGRNPHRRHSDIIQKPKHESARMDSDPKLQLREKLRNGKAAEMMEIQKVEKTEPKEFKSTTDKVWTDIRSLVDQNLPYEVLSEQFLQAQLRLEQAGGKPNKQPNGKGPSSNGHLSIPAELKAVEGKVIGRHHLQKSPTRMKEAESKRKSKDEKTRIMVEVQEAVLSNSEAKRKAGEEKIRVKAAAQKAILEERSATERTKQAARYRGLILPKVQADHLDMETVSEVDPAIDRTIEKSKQAAEEGPKPEVTRPLSTGWIPFSTKVSKVHICKEVLDESKIEYTEELDSFIIHKNVSLTEQINLRFRTNEIRSK